MILCINIGLETNVFTITWKKIGNSLLCKLNVKNREDTEWIYSLTTLDLRTLETSFRTPTNGYAGFICCFSFY